MELEYAILADNAGRLHDGKLVIFGGDIDKATVPKLPALLHTTLVARLLLHPDENLEGHVFGLDCTPAEGERMSIAKDLAVSTIRNTDEPDQPSGARIIVEMTILVSKPGPHFIHLMVDGKEMKQLRMKVSVPRHEEEGK